MENILTFNIILTNVILCNIIWIYSILFGYEVMMLFTSWMLIFYFILLWSNGVLFTSWMFSLYFYSFIFFVLFYFISFIFFIAFHLCTDVIVQFIIGSLFKHWCYYAEVLCMVLMLLCIVVNLLGTGVMVQMCII